MAGLRIRWRRDTSSLPATPAVSSSTASGEVSFDVLAWLFVTAIVILALAARLYNVAWDDNTHLHPDERHLTIVANDIDLPSGIVDYFDSNSTALNPYNLSPNGGGSFVYGTLPLFLTKFSAAALGQDNYEQLVLVGRRLTAVFDAATVLIVFLLGRRLYGPLAGLLGAVLYASAPLAIQHAHFFVVDPYLTFFTAATLYYCVRIVQDGARSDYALAGLLLGLGAASKLTALALLPVLVLAALVRLWPDVRRIFETKSVLSLSFSPQPGMDPTTPLLLPKLTYGLGLALLAAFLAFRVAQPYAFETPGVNPFTWLVPDSHFIDDQQQQARFLGGEVGFPPSVQWIGRTSYLYPLQEMVLWGMGPVFGVLGWAAFAYAAYRLVRWREARHLLLVAFLLVYFGFMGRQFSLYLRYFLPLYPVLAVLAGYALAEALRWASSRRGLGGHFEGTFLGRIDPAVLAQVGVAAVVSISLLLGLAYLSIYTRPVTRVEASRWMYENLPPGSAIAAEHWDDTLPIRLPGTPDRQFQVFELPLYNPDTRDKVTQLIAGISQADYIVLSSNRLLNSIPRNQINYPVTTRYYDLLLKEELGFRLLREFTSYPGLFGIDLPDSNSEESWTSYDHPPVLVFEKTPDFSPTRLQVLLGQGPFAAGDVTPARAEKNGLLLSAADRETQQSDGTWTDVFSDSGIAHSHPTLVWLLVLEVAAFSVTPFAFVLFRRLPDRGYLLAKPLGLLLLAYPVWLLVSLKLLHFTQLTVLAVLLALAVAGALVARRQRLELRQFLRANLTLVLVSEALFLLAFFFFRELRLENPDLWHAFRGGEKPMDVAYLTAVARSTTLPPYDPWFAGGYINYYYLGQFFTATLLKATTIPPEVAFNLAVPTFFAFTFGAAFSVAYGLAAAGRSLARRAPGFRPVPRWSLYAAGLLGAFLVAVAGNLDGFGQMSDRLSAVSPWHYDTWIPLLDSVVNSAGGLWQVVFHGADLQPFDFWRPSRMMPPTISITEFPYFSFLFADLHAHMMTIPFEVLTLGVALSLVLNRRGEQGSRDWAIVALLGLLAGSLRWLNSWDYPTFLLISLASVAISERHLDGGVPATGRRLVLKAALLVGLSYALYLPYLSHYLTPVSGVHTPPETTPVHQYLAHFGLFLAAIGGWLFFVLARALKPSPLARPYHGGPRDLPFIQATGVVLAVTMLVMLYFAYKDLPLVVTLVPVLVVVAYLALRELRRRRADSGLRLFLLALIGVGLGLSIGVDLVTINGDIQRMNTVFKFYLHTWVLFALVSSFAVWQLLFVYWRPTLRLRRPSLRLAMATGTAALAVLFLGAMLYPILATPVRLDDRFIDTPKTLDGLAFMPLSTFNDPNGPIDLSYDYEGIEWMRRNVEGTPPIVEGLTDLYRWGGRFSIYTGLPTVLGWGWHQTQQRGDLAFMVDQRARQVDAFYNTPDVNEAVAFLRQYGVHYVILGQNERLYYQAAGLRKFEAGLGGALEVAYENTGLTIYRVKDGVLARTQP